MYRTLLCSGVDELMLLKYGSVGSVIIETTGAPITPYKRSEIVRSVSSTRKGGGGPVIGTITSIHSWLGSTRSAPIRRTGASESPINVAGEVGDVA